VGKEGLTKSEEKKMQQQFEQEEKERQEIEEGGGFKMKIVEKKDVKVGRRGKNRYDRLHKEILKSVKEKEAWVVEVEESEIYRILGSKERKHLSSKYGLSQQIQKALEELFKSKIYSTFTSTKKMFYISNEKLS